MAMRTPFSVSLPMWAMPPEVGPAWAIRTVCTSWAQASVLLRANTAAAVRRSETEWFWVGFMVKNPGVKG
jgi:hypothetical protein